MKTTKALAKNTIGFTFSRKQIESAGGEILIGDGDVTVTLPIVACDATSIVDAFMEQGFERDEAWLAVDKACAKRNWRLLGEIVL